MFFKIKENFVSCFFLLALVFNDCKSCFKENTTSNSSIKTFDGFYEDCCCTEDGYTVDDLHWLDPNNHTIGPAGTASNVYIEKHDGDIEQRNCLSLITPSASKTASGTYRCVTQYKGVSYLQTHHIDIYDPLYFFNKLPSQYLVQNVNSKVYCKARGAAPPIYRWYRDKDGQEEIFDDSVKYQFVADGLIVKNVTNEDAGIYKCTASIPSTGEEDELDIEVQIMTPPVIQKLLASPEDTVIEGESLIIECIAEGFPIPKYNWRKVPNNKLGDENKNSTWQQNNSIIRFHSVKSEDAGVYQCNANNYAGNTTEYIEIKVLVPPEITSFQNKTAEEGTDISIYCTATGNPTPNVTITYAGRGYDEEKNTTLDQYIDNYALHKVDRTKGGIYICNATNTVDSVMEIMYLTVLHKPYFDAEEEYVWGWVGETVELNCEVEANPPSNFTWKYEKNEEAIADATKVMEELNSIEVKSSQKYTFNITKDFAPYGDFECISFNYLGEGYKLIDLQKGTVPSVVVYADLENVTATSATFTIEPPLEYKGPEALGIKAEYDIAENFNVTDIHRNRTWAIGRPFKLDKLRPNSTYYVKFAAINRVGTGPWGNRTEFKTLDKSAPEPPIWQVDSAELPPSNVLKWKAPEDNGEPIDYYALRYCPVANDSEESLCKEQRIEEATEQELSDLLSNTTYYFELTAHNAVGNSSIANITLIIPAPDMLVAEPLLSMGAIIGISIVLVFLCLILLDLLFLIWRRQGVIASCCYRKSKKKPNPLHTRDKKGLLKDNRESTDETLRRPNNGHREYEYNKTTGIITGKHSSV
ncbi:unnamed protein product [Arctia plantaginis]|uniref:Fasciclin-2-like n=1 Tax=Arctia plantaginis TaxID=874455 RepID=A0A8S1BBL0_ARCPL|nr:unnamed protein product [Arctia plantaginis]